MTIFYCQVGRQETTLKHSDIKLKLSLFDAWSVDVVSRLLHDKRWWWWRPFVLNVFTRISVSNTQQQSRPLSTTGRRIIIISMCAGWNLLQVRNNGTFMWIYMYWTIGLHKCGEFLTDWTNIVLSRTVCDAAAVVLTYSHPNPSVFLQTHIRLQ
jgi:hypothetical protein